MSDTPTQEMSDPLAGLTPEEQGNVVALYTLGQEATNLAFLSPSRVERCGAALARLRELAQPDRERYVAALLDRACSAAPADLGCLHPSWIHEAIRDEPVPLLRVVVESLPESARRVVEPLMPSPGEDPTLLSPLTLSPELLANLGRILLLPLEPLCAEDIGPLAAELRSLPFDGVILRIIGLGAELVGRSLYGAPAGLRARMMATVGEPWASAIGRAAAEKATHEERALAALHAGIVLPPTAIRPEDRLFHVGLSRLKELLLAEGEMGLFAVAGRLPYDLGRPWLGDAWRGW